MPARRSIASTAQTEGSTNSGDYTSILNQGVIFTLNQTTPTVTVSIINDTVVESNETFALLVQRNASDPTSTYLAKSTFTIIDNDVLATTYAITPNPVSVNEGGTPTFTIARSGGMPAETIYASTTQTEGSSNSGDYKCIQSQGVIFTLGQTHGDGRSDDLNDAVVESNETFGLLVQRNVSDPASTYLAKSTFTIMDNDVLATTYAITPDPVTVNRTRAPLRSRSRARAACQRRRSMPVRRRPRALPTVAITRPS